jgi:hypothetical protein
MKKFLIAILSTACLVGCIEQWNMEQRVVELPADNPSTSLNTAAQIGQSLLNKGLAANVHKQFPTLTPQQLQGLSLTWEVGYFNGKRSVFILTGIRYNLHSAVSKG